MIRQLPIIAIRHSADFAADAAFAATPLPPRHDAIRCFRYIRCADAFDAMLIFAFAAISSSISPPDAGATPLRRADAFAAAVMRHCHIFDVFAMPLAFFAA